MEARHEVSYTVKLTDAEFKLVTACLAVCAGVRGVKVDRAEANTLNLRMLENRATHAADQAKIATAALVRAQAHEVTEE